MLHKLLDFLAGLIMPIIRAIAQKYGFFSEDQYGNASHDLQVGWLHIVSGYQSGFYDCIYTRIYYDAGGHIKNLYYWDDNYPDPTWPLRCWFKALRKEIKRWFTPKPKGDMYCPHCGWGYTEDYHRMYCPSCAHERMEAK